MKNLKFILLFVLGLFLSAGNLQAQAKKCCMLPCSKATTAQVNDLQELAPATLVNETTTKQSVKNCDPKNCNPKNCQVKNCPPGCDISKCIKGSKTSKSSFRKGSNPSTASAKSSKPIALY